MKKETGLPLAEGLETVQELPHTVANAIMYNKTLESFNELPLEKRPPRYMWDRPYELSQYLQHVWDRDEDKEAKTSFNLDFEDVD